MRRADVGDAKGDAMARNTAFDPDDATADEFDAGDRSAHPQPTAVTEAVEFNLSLGCRSRDSLLRCLQILARVIGESDSAADVVGLRHELGVFRLTLAIPLGNVTDVVDSRPAAVAGAQLLRTVTNELSEFTPYLTQGPDEVQVHTLETFLRAAPTDVQGTCERLIACITQGRRREPIDVDALAEYSENLDFFDGSGGQGFARTGS